MLKIKNIYESLIEDLNAEKITMTDAAVELYNAGHINRISETETAERLNRYKVEFMNTLEQRLKKGEKVLIKTPFNEKNYELLERGGKLGINYNTAKRPYTNSGNVFVPMEQFAPGVIFEDIQNGTKYHYSTIKKCLEIVE